MKRTLFIIVICLLFIKAFTQGFVPQQVIVQSETKSEKYSVPVQDKQKNIVGYIDKDNALKENLFYSPKDNAFYSLKTSDKIRNNFANTRTGFYGDEVLDPTRQSYTLNDGNYYLKYLGSADITGDTLVTFADKDSLEIIIQNGGYVDEADVDLSGFVTNADLTLMTQFLRDEIDYLPAHKDLLQTQTERINYFQAIMDNIDSLDIVSHPNWLCGEYRLSTTMDYNGIKDPSNAPAIDPQIIDTTRNSRYGDPVYGNSSVNIDGTAHSFNTVFVGNYTTDFTDWYFFDNIFGTQVEPGDWSMDGNSYANIGRYCKFYSTFVGDTIYGVVDLINFDLENGVAISYEVQHPDVILSRTLIDPSLSGIKPADTLIDSHIGTHPNNTGWPTGLSPNVTDTVWYIQETTQAGNIEDSIYHNFEDFMYWQIKGEHPLVNKTLATTDTINFPNRFAQIISKRDTLDPYVNEWDHGPNTIYYSELDSIPLADFEDLCGYCTEERVSSVSTQGSNPDSCNYYNDFTQIVTDRGTDPTGNFKDSTFVRSVYLDPHQWSSFPGPVQIEYRDTITTNHTGGLPTAYNPAGIQVFVNQDPPKLNSTQNPDSTLKQHYWYEFDFGHNAIDSVCYNTIQQNQHVTVIETDPPYFFYVPPDTTVLKGTNLHPDNLGWAVAEDTISGVPPEVTYEDELIEEIPGQYRLWERHWDSEDICNYFAPDTSSFITEDLTVGINEGGLEKELKKDYVKLFPNPANNIINVSCNKEFLLEIYDITGRKLLCSNSTTTVVSQLSKGIYIILLKDEQGVLLEKEKLIVE